MNDCLIRRNFHKKKLARHHASADTLVVDELGLKHGKYRADIAVINGHLIGYEIKSNDDSLGRLAKQAEGYSSIFDRVTAVVGGKHLAGVKRLVPEWWGLIVASEGVRGGIHFETERRATLNLMTEDFAVAQLLWRGEAVSELIKLGYTGKILRKNRSELYNELIIALGTRKLRSAVRARLKLRKNWRCPERLLQDDDSSRLFAK